MLESEDQNAETLISELDNLTQSNQEKQKNIKTLLKKNQSLLFKYLKSLLPDINNEFLKKNLKFPSDELEFCLYIKSEAKILSEFLKTNLKDYLDSLKENELIDQAEQINAIKELLIKITNGEKIINTDNDLVESNENLL